MHLRGLTAIISTMPLTAERTKIRVVLLLAGLAGLGTFLFATGRGNDQRALYDRFFLYLPASSFLLVVVLVTTDLCIGVVERRVERTTGSRVSRLAIVLAVGLTVAAVLVAAVLLLWFR